MKKILTQGCGFTLLGLSNFFLISTPFKGCFSLATELASWGTQSTMMLWWFRVSIPLTRIRLLQSGEQNKTNCNPLGISLWLVNEWHTKNKLLLIFSTLLSVFIFILLLLWSVMYLKTSYCTVYVVFHHCNCLFLFSSYLFLHQSLGEKLKYFYKSCAIHWLKLIVKASLCGGGNMWLSW